MRYSFYNLLHKTLITMKTYHFLLATLCIGLLSFSCSGNKNKPTVDVNRTDFILPDGLKSIDNDIFMKEGEALTSYFAENHIDANKRNELKIDKINYARLDSGDSGTEDSNEYLHSLLIKAPNENIIAGEVLDEIGKGKILSVYLLHMHPGNPNMVDEFFITYDKKGNYIDSKVVSSIMPFVASEIKYEVKNNIISVEYDQGGEGWYQFYKVMPDLTIVKVSSDGSELVK